MKIKQDFVTNSSSMSYVVIFPGTINPDEMLSITEHLGIMKNSTADIELVKKILYAIQGSVLWIARDEYEEELIYNEVNTSFRYAVKVMEECELPIQHIDSGPDNMPHVYNLGSKENVKKIEKLLKKEGVNTNELRNRSRGVGAKPRRTRRGNSKK